MSGSLPPAFSAFICKVVVAIVDPILLLLTTAAFVYFLWGVAKVVIQSSQGEEALDEKRSMLWGIVGLAIIFGVYGIVNFAIATANGVGFSIATFTGPSCAAAGVMR
jgi:hypothetical protein